MRGRYRWAIAERARALALEELFDEQLAPEVRRLVWHHMLDDTEAAVDTVLLNASPARRRVAVALMPALKPAVRRDYGVSQAGATRAVERIRAAMDRIESELEPSGYLVGDGFTVADLTAASLLTPLLAPPGRQYQPPISAPALLEVRAELDARPGGAWVSEMYSRHRGGSAEVGA